MLPKKQIDPLSMEFGKVSPQAIDLEECVLGALMLESESIYEIIDDISAESFYKDDNQKIFAAIKWMYDNNKAIDIITVSNELRNRKQLEDVGGPVYISQLTGKIATAHHIKDHARIVQQKFIQREIIRASSELNRMGFDEGVDVEDLLDYTNHEIAKINELLLSNKTDQHVSVALKKAKDELRNRELNAKNNVLNGIKTPLTKLDDITNGWQPGLVILAARPSMGKTQLLIEIIKSCSLSGVPCFVESLEMSALSLANRLITACGDINLRNFYKGLMTSENWSSVNKEIKYLEKLPIYIDDYSKSTISRIKSQIRVHHKKYGIGLAIIDFLTYIKIEASGNYKKNDELGKITKECKDLSKELNIPIVMLAQLNRQIEMRAGDHRPKLSDLKESGEIEEDADMVIFIHRPEYYGIKESPTGANWKGYGELIIAKHRDGALDDIPFKYDPGIRNIRDYDIADKKGLRTEKKHKDSSEEKELTWNDVPLDDIEDEVPF